MYVMAAALSDDSRSYKDIKNEYFSSPFGSYGDEIYDILSNVSS